MLALIHPPDIARRHPGELSGGQRQRVARAVAYPPRVLLMDEPLGALDVKLREAMQAEIRTIQRTLGITTIFVAHDQAEAISLSDRIVVTNHGRVPQSGTPRELYDHPASHFVADFFGRVNLLPIEVSDITHAAASFILCGRTLRLDAGPIPVARGAATFALRPEHPRPHRHDAAIAGRDALPGHVVRTRFLGNVMHCEAALSDALTVLVETRPDDPLAASDTKVQVAWEPARGAVFADEDATR